MVIASRIPWEDPELQFPANLGLAWWESLTGPRRFFARVDWNDRPARAVLYWLLVWIAAGLIGLLRPAGSLEAMYATLLGSDPGLDGRLLQLLHFFLTPFSALVTLAAWTALQHLFASLLAPEHRSIRATGVVICYAAGPVVLAAIPVPAILAWVWSPGVWVWGVVLLVAGLREAHSTSTSRAVAIVVLPIIVVTLAVGLLVALVALGSNALPEMLT